MDPKMIMEATEALRKKVGHLTCPVCNCKQTETNFKAGILQTSDFPVLAYTCPNCGYVFQFRLSCLLDK